MKKKFKITLVVFLVVILGCFSDAFAATNQNTELKKSIKANMSRKLLDSTTTDDGAEIGNRNLNGTAENSAQEGNILKNPEIGWKRYDDADGNFIYNGKWSFITTNTSCYKTTYHTGSKDAIISFKFKGSMLRIIGISDDCRSRNVKVDIDGKIATYDEYTSNQKFQALLYKNESLQDGIHEVTIYQNDTGKYMNIDAIDINNSGYLIKIAKDISLSKSIDSLSVGQSDNLIATVTPDDAGNKTVTWVSSDPNIATVDSTGKVTAVKAGTVTITATTTDGTNLKASCTVTVNDPTSITLNKTTDLINVGETDKLIASVTPAGQAVTWESSDSSIATVDGNGNVTGIKAGTVVITAATEDGKTASCTVTVKEQENEKSKLTLYMNDGTTREFYLTQDEIDNFINWYTSKVKGEVTMQPYYVFNVSVPGSSSAKKSYVWFMKIESFEVE